MTNHVFTGWFADSACTQVWDFATLITADRTLYAGWEELPRYTVSFDSQGGSTVTNRTVYKGRPV
ncbi:MAG TPA: InlB B-repeat-containing protein, partial [Spirochaetota bacterium]|nr:InlB B-repeat-containing protein [Spirochaetota bacterium]